MHSTLRCWRLSAVVLLARPVLLGVLPSQPPGVTNDFKDKALACEKRHDWLEACRWYDKAAPQGPQPARTPRRLPALPAPPLPASAAARTRLPGSRRQADPVPGPGRVRSGAGHRRLGLRRSVASTDVNSLFQQGVQELRYDFDEDVFLQEYLPGASPRPWPGSRKRWRPGRRTRSRAAPTRMRKCWR